MKDCVFCGSELKNEIYQHYTYCNNCNIAFRDELPDADHRKALCSEDWVEKHSMDKDIQSKADNLVRKVREIIRNGRILDVGCASGVLVDKLSKDGYKATGIDWSEPAISFAKKHMRGSYVVGEADLSCIEDSYDIVIASHILEHIDNPVQFFEGVRKVLVNNGWLIAEVPNLNWYVPDSCMRSNPSSIFEEDHSVCYSPRGLLKILNQFGFYDVQLFTRTTGTILLQILLVNVCRKIKRQTKQLSTDRDRTVSIVSRNKSNRLVSLIMNPFNRLSERNYKGMDLIAVGRIGK